MLLNEVLTRTKEYFGHLTTDPRYYWGWDGNEGYWIYLKEDGTLKYTAASAQTPDRMGPHYHMVLCPCPFIDPDLAVDEGL